MDLDQLKRLQQAATDACKAAEAAGVDDAVNWGDLYCFDAIFCIDQDGNLYSQVFIEEASPDAVHFQNFVQQYLKERGFGFVLVTTTW